MLFYFPLFRSEGPCKRVWWQMEDLKAGKIQDKVKDSLNAPRKKKEPADEGKGDTAKAAFDKGIRRIEGGGGRVQSQFASGARFQSLTGREPYRQTERTPQTSTRKKKSQKNCDAKGPIRRKWARKRGGVSRVLATERIKSHGSMFKRFLRTIQGIGREQ